MLAGFIIHVYEGTAHQPGTFRSMMDGTVTESWAWTHHPGWFRTVTGRDPREADELEEQRLNERADVVERSRPDLDSRDKL
jgi:cytochrome b subunit of formate dehydrogenase